MLGTTQIFVRVIGVIASSLLFIYFLNDFFKVRLPHRLFRALGFLSFVFGAGLSLLIGSPNDYSLPIIAAGMTVLYFSLVLDTHSRLRFSIFLPILALIFLRENQLLLSLSIMDSIALLELSYSNAHRRYIPFVSAFVLIAIAQYFNVYEKILDTSSIVPQILYLFSSLIFLLWVIFYLFRKSLGMVLSSRSKQG